MIFNHLLPFLTPKTNNPQKVVTEEEVWNTFSPQALHSDFIWHEPNWLKMFFVSTFKMKKNSPQFWNKQNLLKKSSIICHKWTWIIGQKNGRDLPVLRRRLASPNQFGALNNVSKGRSQLAITVLQKPSKESFGDRECVLSTCESWGFLVFFVWKGDSVATLGRTFSIPYWFGG